MFSHPPWSFWTVLLVWLLVFLTGCQGPGFMSPVLKDLGEVLDKPAVQSTLEKWSAKASLHNPRLGGQLTTGFELYTTGLDLEGDVSGNVNSKGIDPARLDALIKVLGTLKPAPTSQPTAMPGVGPPLIYDPPDLQASATRMVDPNALYITLDDAGQPVTFRRVGPNDPKE